MRQILHWIGGTPTESGRPSPVFNPSTGLVQAEVGLADADLVNHAIATAEDAAIEWREVSLAERARIMFRFRELLAARWRDRVGHLR